MHGGYNVFIIMIPAEIHDLSTKKMPTGITSLDPMMEGGVPPGSLILFLSEIGAGRPLGIVSRQQVRISGGCSW